LGYIDFLEALTRVTEAYPFTEDELSDITSFEMKMKYFIDKLEDKYKGLKDQFSSVKLKTRSIEKGF
jgi:hypothetical protein